MDGHIITRGNAGYCFGAPFAMDCVASDWVAAGMADQPVNNHDPELLTTLSPSRRV